MQVTIDAAGRIVVPKSLRDRLGLTAGTQLEITPTLDGLLVTPEHRQEPNILESDGWLLIEPEGTAPNLNELLEIRDAERR